MLNQRNDFFKMLILLAALAFSAASDASVTPLLQPGDYTVVSTDLYTRIDIVKKEAAQNVYASMRLQEVEQENQSGSKSKYKSFVNKPNDNKPPDLFFWCGTTETSDYSCYFQIQKNETERLFESPLATSLKLNAVSDSKKWMEALPLQGNPNSRIISALIIENFLETYCEESSLNNEDICHVTIYKEAELK